MLKLMANFKVFQIIYQQNFCISTGIKTTANFLITDIETASFLQATVPMQLEKFNYAKALLEAGGWSKYQNEPYPKWKYVHYDKLLSLE